MIPFVGTIRRKKIVTAMGRFTTGSRRFSHCQMDARISRHTLHRVCFPPFGTTIRTTKMGTIVAKCGPIGKVCYARGDFLVSILGGR